MIRSTALAAVFALAACGGGSDAAVEPDTVEPDIVETTATTESDSTEDTTVETVTDEDSGANTDDVPCGEALTAAEIDSILGTSVSIGGGGGNCLVEFAADAVGTVSVFSGSRADEAMDALLPKFKDDETASANGVLLADDRGFIDGRSVIVRGDSGSVFRFDVPDNVEIADVNAAMEQLAAILLTR